ncbi:deoxyguanosinetriphosphate triphosphohydrolase [Altererythrobacter aurantiacus]|uniref:Deoxyguanosinetriphosphate triphosphohydrolase-like protein n=1 Tax=Parapontixanthobacter aurantiacus TaxID=1463599 RepID=A0A844ZCB9_9SPHN|nr:deoxyguanosinetriphosphate triphosphohydrolase [Parapontixanthobacter aurantiacus]MXO84806.1 deoxyguanosinetriphosphate triphosphohydrolase [Parapontixanthobacter aurantiacus]
MPLAPYAADPDRSPGREFAENRQGSRGPRSEFQRDRDRTIHSIAFRRLRSKTQVFVAPDGDHYRTRLTHSLEVAQIGRVIARELGLDEDLTEALCLAHDIGHPPFGHAGENALSNMMSDSGGFDHNAHTLRTLMRLESPYCDHPGLNLTWDMLEGLAKHNGPIAEPNWALRQLDDDFPLALDYHASLEAQVAAIADDIAYDNHDIDDGLRAGFLNIDDVLSLEFMAQPFREIERRFPNADRATQLRELIRTQIGRMVLDVLETARANVVDVGSVAEVRAAGRTLITFSDEMARDERRLKSFMYDKLYYHPEQVATADRASKVIRRLFEAYADDESLLPPSWHAALPSDRVGRDRHIADFIAGMTDRFAIDRYQEITGRRPDGLSNV